MTDNPALTVVYLHEPNAAAALEDDLSIILQSVLVQRNIYLLRVLC